MNLRDRVQQKMAECRPYYERVLELRPLVAQPDADWVVWSALERNLQLALECAIDLGELVISWKRLERPEENRQVFLILAREGLIDVGLGERLARAAGLRNLLVHQYGQLDRARVREMLSKDFKDIEVFAQTVAKLVEAEG